MRFYWCFLMLYKLVYGLFLYFSVVFAFVVGCR